jgi:hypothetical protein
MMMAVVMLMMMVMVPLRQAPLVSVDAEAGMMTLPSGKRVNFSQPSDMVGIPLDELPVSR